MTFVRGLEGEVPHLGHPRCLSCLVIYHSFEPGPGKLGYVV